MVHGPLRNSSGSCLRSLSASARFFSAHFLPSARLFAASPGSALTCASRMTLASIALVLMETSGLGSAAVAAAAHTTAPAKPMVRLNAMNEVPRKGDPLEGGAAEATPPPRYAPAGR